MDDNVNWYTSVSKLNPRNLETIVLYRVSHDSDLLLTKSILNLLYTHTIPYTSIIQVHNSFREIYSFLFCEIFFDSSSTPVYYYNNYIIIYNIVNPTREIFSRLVFLCSFCTFV